MKFREEIVRLDVGAVRTRGIRGAALQDFLVAELFFEYLEERNQKAAARFLADLSCSQAPFAQIVSGLRRKGRVPSPSDKGKPWKSPQAVGLHEQHVAASCPLPLTVDPQAREAMARAYAKDSAASGLALSAFEGVLDDLIGDIEPTFKTFLRDVEAIQKVAGGGRKLDQEAERELRAERRHTAEQLGKLAGGQFIIHPVALDKRPLLQVSPEIERAVSPERARVAERVAKKVQNVNVVTGLWAKSTTEAQTLLVCGKSGDARTAFTEALKALGVSYRVSQATEQQVRQASAAGRAGLLAQARDRLRPSEASQKDSADRKARELRATPKLHPMSSGGGANEIAEAVLLARAGLQKLNLYERTKNATLEASTIQGMKEMQSGSGRYWIYLFANLERKDDDRVTLQVWLYRGSSPPRPTDMPSPMARKFWTLILDAYRN